MVDSRATILVVSQDAVFGNALRRVLNGEYQTESTSTLPTSDPNVDLIVWHLGGSPLPGEAGIEAFSCPTLVVGPAHADAIISAVEARALGFVADDAPLDEVVESIAVVMEGGAVVPPALLGTLLRYLVERRRRPAQTDELKQLTTRELEVFHLAANGAGRDEIARRLFISPNTARTHLQRVYRKIGVHSRSELVAVAARLGHLDMEEDL